MIILIGSNKGGTGKTTLTSNLAVAFAQKNIDLLVVDADPQQSISRWSADREENRHTPTIQVTQKIGNIAQTLAQFDKKYDVILVDVAGRNSKELLASATVADYLIAPHSCSQLDLDTLAELDDQLENIQPINPDLKSYIYQTMASTNPNVEIKEINDFNEYAKNFNNFTVLKSVNYYRKIYKDVIEFGQSVLEVKSSSSSIQKAQAEVESIVNELFSNLKEVYKHG